MKHSITSFLDVLALTIVGLLWTWSPGKHAALPMAVPRVDGPASPVRTAVPLAVVVTPNGDLLVDDRPATVATILADVTAAPRPVHLCAEPATPWGTVAGRIAEFQAHWQWVQAGVRVR